MGFGDQIKQFADNQKKELEQARKQVGVNAEERLRQLLGADFKLVKNIKLDADVGKFYDVDAPEAIVKKIRAAGLLKD